MADQHTIKIKLGGSEFEATGSESVVDAQFKQFLDALRAIQERPTPAEKREEPARPADIPPARTGDGDIGTFGMTSEDPILSRVYTQDRRVGVSLRILPKTTNKEADALILLLYGFARLLNEHDVLGGKLMKASQQSGFPVDRVDTYLLSASYRDLVTKAGFKRGSRYGLNNRGTARAEEILKVILG